MSDAAPSEILPDKGLVYGELRELQPVLCRPKLLPIKSYSLQRLERLEKKMALEAKQRRDAGRAERGVAAWNTAPTAQQQQQQQRRSSVTIDDPSAQEQPPKQQPPKEEVAEAEGEAAPQSPTSPKSDL